MGGGPMPESLGALVIRMLADDPAERPGLREVVAVLDSIIGTRERRPTPWAAIGAGGALMTLAALVPVGIIMVRGRTPARVVQVPAAVQSTSAIQPRAAEAAETALEPRPSPIAAPLAVVAPKRSKKHVAAPAPQPVASAAPATAAPSPPPPVLPSPSPAPAPSPSPVKSAAATADAPKDPPDYDDEIALRSMGIWSPPQKSEPTPPPKKNPEPPPRAAPAAAPPPVNQQQHQEVIINF
jgi:hypothetical protein